MVYPHHSDTERAIVVQRVFAAFQSGLAAAGRSQGDQAAETGLRADEVLLITYGDTVRNGDDPHVRTLAAFLSEHLEQVFSTVHVLPFFPASSDGGFSIVDFDAVAEPLGDWDDITSLPSSELMVDLVCNHGSAKSEWFAQFVSDTEPGRSMFLTADPTDDHSMVVRPRTHPLLLPVATAAGEKHVWVTFSEDQVDFDFANPDVLIEFCRILGSYLGHGATRVRLDAIAYLWKEVGTSCIHLPQTHQIVKLMRCLVESHDERVLLITETNVPHNDNVSYFGDGDEGHVVYNFTLAPLIIWSLIAQRADVLSRWLKQVEVPPAGCAFLNFLASHDGIGLRPVEGLIASAELDQLVQATKEAGGDYSSYATPVGDRPYELNVSLVDLLAGRDGERSQTYVLAHALMLAVQGIPAVYVHSMLVSPGDVEAVRTTGHKRAINRASIELDQAVEQIGSGWRGSVHEDLKRLIKVRRSHDAFGPEALQEILYLHPSVVAIQRGGTVLALHNVTSRPVDMTNRLPHNAPMWDAILERPFDGTLSPWQAAWLVPHEVA